jgi:hypothetical protein
MPIWASPFRDIKEVNPAVLPSTCDKGVAREEETANKALLKLASVVTIRLPTKLKTPS